MKHFNKLFFAGTMLFSSQVFADETSNARALAVDVIIKAMANTQEPALHAVFTRIGGRVKTSPIVVAPSGTEFSGCTANVLAFVLPRRSKK
jgi:hypothetical protein